MIMDYEHMLNEAYEKLPKQKTCEGRFEIPIVETMLQGNQTIVKNFQTIAQALRREPKHLLKFLTKELATPASIDGGRAMFQTKISQKMIQTKLESYVKEYIICRECKRPDTKLEREGRIEFLKCEACGARSSVKQLK
jgi:translation initiation factor 2 subunit 2